VEETRRAAGIQDALHEVLGYLNFSSGAADPRFLRNLNEVFLAAESADPNESHVLLRRWLYRELDNLHEQSGAFADDTQARAVMRIWFDGLLPAYRSFHRDLLFHQKDGELWRPFFLGEAAEAILRQGGPWDETERITEASLAELNSFIGYRPVAVLESQQKIEPYAHEWVRPIPLYIAGAGVAVGSYDLLIEKTLALLHETDPDLLAQAWFDPDLLEELALDPRAYDFDHPVNKRPNYHFGTWDLHRIDNKGRFRRFVLQQVTLDSLLARLESPGGIRRDELLTEAAAVLAGTMLMASATTGGGPGAHDSSTSLGTLLPYIAGIRDRFYEQLLQQLHGGHAERLRAEAVRLHQPFGGARQHLNQELARRRATQLQRLQLAQLYARMGYPDAALRQAHTVRVASARMLSQIHCRLTAGRHAIDSHQLGSVREHLLEIEDLLHRAIECGALMDPWNIVGFAGNFSLFPALENSIRDYRADDLVELMEQIFGLCARAVGEAAAQDDEELEGRFAEIFGRLAGWWDQFATPTVSGVKPLVGKDVAVSTNLVAGALNAWHKSGAEAGDIAFWRLFADQFDTAKSFQLVVEALLERQDAVASVALLMQWLSQAERTPLEDGDSSFHRLIIRWIRWLTARERPDETTDGQAKRWDLVRKLFELLEANAESLWRVPHFELAQQGADSTLSDSPVGDDAQLSGDWDDDEHDEDEEDDEHEQDDAHLYSAAYEEVTYQDSTDDGIEGEILDFGDDLDDLELKQEARRLGERLAFHATLARLWRHAVIGYGAYALTDDDRRGVFRQWRAQAAEHSKGLLSLLSEADRYRIRAPSGQQEAMVQYDRCRMIREVLIERIIATSVQMRNAERLLEAVGGEDDSGDDRCGDDDAPLLEAVHMVRRVLASDVTSIRKGWPEFIQNLASQELLHVPLVKGGHPRRIVRTRSLGQFVCDLAEWLPKLGLVREVRQLLETAQRTESRQPVAPGAITEFDQMFERGYRAIVRCLIASAADWDQGESADDATRADNMLVEALRQLTETESRRWLRHSGTVRLSVVEKFASDDRWDAVVEFIRRYGRDLFTQQFLNVGNLRAILFQGVETWLATLEGADEDHPARHLYDDWVEAHDERAKAKLVEHLTFCLEAVLENYLEYRDYNSTTTQSDRGDMFYTLLDFLRLRANYDRVAWNLKPVLMAHEVLTRQGRNAAAEIWRRELARESGEAADRYLCELHDLSEKHGMRLPTITERLSERFIRPLAVDRVRALVRGAMEAASGQGDSITFSLLQQEIESLTSQPASVGADLPSWMEALEEEVSAIQASLRGGATEEKDSLCLEQRRLTWDEVQDQLKD